MTASRSDVLVSTIRASRALDRAGVLTASDRERLFALMEREHLKGGPGSGNFGHRGRVGERGGSQRRGLYDARVETITYSTYPYRLDVDRNVLSGDPYDPVDSQFVNGYSGLREILPQRPWDDHSTPTVIYRSMSSYEFGRIQETREIQSEGAMNLSGQDGMTFYDDDGSSMYAEDNFKKRVIENHIQARYPEFPTPVLGDVAYIVGIRTPEDIQVNRQGEYFTTHPTDASRIVRVIEARPSTYDPREFSFGQFGYRDVTSEFVGDTGLKGGIGSGYRDHPGRSGQRGGSARKPTDYKPGYLPQYLLESLVVTKGHRTTAQLEELRNRILENGITEPIWLQYDDDKITILDGNHRIEFAKEFGIDQLPVRVVNRSGAEVDPEVVYRKWLSLGGTNRVLKGGKGSGNFGHEGRPGKRGGSSSDFGSDPRDFESGADKARRMLFEEVAQENIVTVLPEGGEPQTMSIREARKFLSTLPEESQVRVNFEREKVSPKQFEGIPVYKAIVSHSGMLSDEELAQRITRDGLKLGPSWHSRPPSVYFTTSEEAAHRYALQYFPDIDTSDGYGIVEFRIPPGLDVFNDTVDQQAIDGGETSFRIETPVDSTWITHVRIYDPPVGGQPKHVQKEFKSVESLGYAVLIVERSSIESLTKSLTDFTPDLKLWEKRVLNLLKDKRPLNPRPFRSDVIPSDVKSLIEDGLESCLVAKDVKNLFEYALKGGQGSGNFGHEGRPGERGGSADDGIDNSIESRKSELIRLASSVGVDPKKIVFSSSDKYDSVFKDSRVLGEYDPRSKTVTMYPESFSLMKEKSILVHELAHASFSSDQASLAIGKIVSEKGQEKQLMWADAASFGYVSDYTSRVQAICKTSGNYFSLVREAHAELTRLDFEGRLDEVSSDWRMFYSMTKPRSSRRARND